MAFQKKNWQFNDIITEGELNRMEDGIEEGISKAEQVGQTAEQAQQTAQQAQQTANQTASSLATHLAETVTESVTITGTDITALTTTDVALAQNRRPKGMRIYATALWTSRGTSIGEYAQIGTANQCFFLYESGLSSVSTGLIALLGTNENNYMGARISAINEGYITLNWQKIGNPPPSANYMIQIVAVYHD